MRPTNFAWHRAAAQGAKMKTKIHLTFDFNLDTRDIDSKGDLEWAVFNRIIDHIESSDNIDDFYGTDGMAVDFTENDSNITSIEGTTIAR